MLAVNIFLYVIIFCIGTVFGSFFTLAVYRIPIGKDITHERSFCPNCNHRLSFFDMIPVLSYLFLGGKCRYCKQKIRPRYFLLELMSGIVFVLFALSLKIDILHISINTLVYFVFGLLYFATLFILAGIDKENIKIQKSVVLFGFVVETIYILVMYLINPKINMYFYIICLILIGLLETLDIVLFRKNLKKNYIIDILQLVLMLVIYSNIIVAGMTIILAALSVLLWFILRKLFTKKYTSVKTDGKKKVKIPLGFFLCVSNIICVILCNFIFI